MCEKERCFLSCYAVLDLEMCGIPSDKKPAGFDLNQEIIQIGAVLLDENYNTVSEFSTYVSPVYGEIDSFIQNLTGISQSDLEGAPGADKALADFLEWLPEDAVAVSWSTADPDQIRKEIRNKKLPLEGFERYFETWNDCQKTFSEKVDNPRNYNLSEAVAIAGVESAIAAEHTAIADAENTALLFKKMCTEAEFKVSPVIVTDESSSHLEYKPFANLLELFNAD